MVTKTSRPTQVRVAAFAAHDLPLLHWLNKRFIALPLTHLVLFQPSVLLVYHMRLIDQIFTFFRYLCFLPYVRNVAWKIRKKEQSSIVESISLTE